MQISRETGVIVPQPTGMKLPSQSHTSPQIPCVIVTRSSLVGGNSQYWSRAFESPNGLDASSQAATAQRIASSDRTMAFLVMAHAPFSRYRSIYLM